MKKRGGSLSFFAGVVKTGAKCGIIIICGIAKDFYLHSGSVDRRRVGYEGKEKKAVAAFGADTVLF